MNWFKKRRQARLPGPVPAEILDAHREAIAGKREAAERSHYFKELTNNMIIRHKRNGFGEKLEAVYEGKGLL